MSGGKYILEGKSVKPEDDLLRWAKWFETANRQVAVDEINGVTVSTVFLGIDHSWNDQKPKLFETMIFGGQYDQEQERYCTWHEAEAGHQRWLAKVKEEYA